MIAMHSLLVMYVYDIYENVETLPLEMQDCTMHTQGFPAAPSQAALTKTLYKGKRSH